MAPELATSLRGQAQGVLSDLEPIQRKDYQSLVTALTARFEPDNQSEIFRSKLKNRVCGQSEALTELAQDLKMLVRKAYPDTSSEMRDRFAKDSFIYSLHDPDLEWAIQQGRPQTMQDALKLSHEYEAFRAGRSRRPRILK